ncbi:MAG: T9SS type A sorting domain-containing protein [Bacteroidota bacterium]|nr:T9SS type A sorting domain-containing protein [Bacteroidota bacterium]
MVKIYKTIFLKKVLLSLAFTIAIYTGMAQTVIPLPAHASSYSGNTRGMWFTAPVSFTITGLRVPTDVGTGAQSLHLVRFPTVPPTYSATTTTFTTLYYGANIATTTFIPVNITVNAGDVIGVLGARNNGSGTGLTSYGAAASATTIAGASATLYRLGWQGSILSGPAANFWYEASSIGRVEIQYVTTSGTNNAGISGLISPISFCAGTHQIKIKIADKGTNRLDSVRVNWQMDGVPQPTIYWTSPLDTLGSPSFPNDTIITLGSMTFVSGIARTLKAWTSMPNGVADTSNNDDTLNVVLKSSLNGIYTIGGSSPDYPTLAAAAADLNSYGICSPVVLNIRSGTYSGQANFGNISGVSATNTILIQSQTNHRDSVTLTYSATATTDNYTLKITNSNYIKIKDITIVATGTTYARALEIAGTSSFDTIQNCSLITIASTASSANIAALFADPLTGGNNVIKNNGISGGSYGLFYSGTSTSVQTSNNVIEGNTITGAGYYSAYIYYTLNTIFRNNTVSVTAPSYTTHYAVTIGYSDGPIEVTGNKVTATGLSATLHGLRIYYCDASATQKGLVANNVITVQSSGTTYGFYCYNSSYQNYYHNSVNSISTGATNYAAYLYNSSASYDFNTFRNNIYANTGTTGYAMYVYNPLYISGDYNLLYSTGVGMVYKGVATATAYTTLNAYRAAFPTQETNSIVYFPAFTSSSNHQPNTADTASWAMNGRGIQNTLVTTDINGTPRPTTLATGVPDLGAYEFTPNSIPPLATMVAGPAITGYVNQIYLFGGDTIARLAFDSVYGAPAFVHVRRSTGTVPPNMGASPSNYMFFYDSIYAPSGTYSYDMEMFYKNAWLGTMSNEGNMTIIKSINPPSAPWVLTGFTPTVDSTNNKITATSLTSFGVYAGTDVSSPLPVKLLSLNANATAKSIHVSWITASEINSNYFSLERSSDGKLFESITSIKASGNSKSYRKYSFDDVQGKSLLSKGMLYYRLAIFDRDGKMEYSKTVAVKENNKLCLNTEIFPNPFSDQLVLNVDNFDEAEIKVEIMDIYGKLRYSGSFTGNSHIINNMDVLPAGIYFAKLSSNLEIKVVALIKR